MERAIFSNSARVITVWASACGGLAELPPNPLGIEPLTVNTGASAGTAAADGAAVQVDHRRHPLPRPELWPAARSPVSLSPSQNAEQKTRSPGRKSADQSAYQDASKNHLEIFCR